MRPWNALAARLLLPLSGSVEMPIPCEDVLEGLELAGETR